MPENITDSVLHLVNKLETLSEFLIQLQWRLSAPNRSFYYYIITTFFHIFYFFYTIPIVK